METNDKKSPGTEKILARTHFSELRGRQSVRATFKLSAECISAISILAAHLGIKQKSLFDYLMEDLQLLSEIAQEIVNARFKRSDRIQKTFVVSRKSLHALDEISSSFDASRDALVEYSVQRLLPTLARERQKHDMRKKIFSDIGNHFTEAETILKKTGDLLGREDPVYEHLEAAVDAYRSAFQHIEDFIEKTRSIEDFHIED